MGKTRKLETLEAQVEHMNDEKRKTAHATTVATLKALNERERRWELDLERNRVAMAVRGPLRVTQFALFC